MEKLFSVYCEKRALKSITMPIDALQTVDIIEVMENFLSRRRPPAHLRDKVDLNYKIENQNIIIYEIRPVFKMPGKKIESPIARATFVKSSKQWKVYWMRANGKWCSYDLKPVVNILSGFIKLVEEDKHHCFWG
jgi:hypothetical protein